MGLADILNDSTLKHYVTAERLPVSKLEVKDAFNQLSDKEKMYAHYFSQACLAGAPIVLHQVSTESPLIFELIVSMFQNGVDPLRKQNVVSDKDFDNLLIYVSQFLGNMGNYLSFGDSKFIPRLEKENFEKVVKASGSDKALSLWEKVKDAIYELKTGKLELDFGNNAYYNDSVTKEDAEKVQKYMDENNLIPNHTRLFKVGQNQFELRIASVEAREEAEFEYEGVKIKKIYGDFAEYNRRIRDNLQQALKYAANDKQASMIEKYIEYYNSGDIEAHVDSQRFWIQDKSPAVETNIGHIETYRDPLRVRGEFEGFVAVVNKEMSKKYGVLVDHAEELLKVLPWNKECPEQPFEIEKFSRPDFTSLEVLTFTTSGIPAGINIPNYPQVREVDGFKNVSLGNVLNATAPSEEITFLKENDQVLFRDLKGAAFGLQVAAHELLGHGSGRQITADKDGKLPFDLSKLISPVDKKPVSTFYKHGESFNSKFGEISNSYEECRAEAVGIYLTTFYEFLKIFGYEKDSQSTDDVVYVNWLLMVRAGLLGLEFYNPTSQKWLQAHMRARYCILQVLLEAGEGLVTIEENGDQVFITLDRSKIRTVGVQAIYNFLLKLGVYKSVCDVAAGSAMYEKYTSVNERFLNLRRIVMDKKQPRKVFVQPLTTIVNNNVELVEFEPSHEGMIKCFTQLVKL